MCVDRNLFADLDSVSKEFECAICHDIMIEPVSMCCNNKANHVFGRECIDKALGNKNSCPLCNHSFYYESVKYIPMKYYTNALNKLQLKCQNECSWTGLFEEYENHLKICENKPYKCDCNNSILHKNKEEHQKICPFVQLDCVHCNKKYYRRDEIKYHGIWECNGCRQKYNVCTSQSHTAVCDDVVIQCKYGGCMHNCKRKDMKEHLLEIDTHLFLCYSDLCAKIYNLGQRIGNISSDDIDTIRDGIDKIKDKLNI